MDQDLLTYAHITYRLLINISLVDFSRIFIWNAYFGLSGQLFQYRPII
ncbi:hypothetical protein DDI_4303 [Dickeya dianthicola RNS04.9]|nr:hypothetical protein DDI_4303 [Dickeya dianthicola RNS04.9]